MKNYLPASLAVVPPRLFREFELPRLQMVFGELKRSGAAANWLHIAGPVSGILPYYPKAGMHIANFDYSVNEEDAMRGLPNTCLDGNIKSLAFVDGSPEEIEAEAKNLQKSFRDRGGYILSSGCEIPPESRSENVAALVGAANEVR